jgi:hypothetical protein
MTLSFPNRSRFFDSTRRAVRFWGYDTAMEASFFITEDALKQVQPDMRFDEAGHEEPPRSQSKPGGLGRNPKT